MAKVEQLCVLRSGGGGGGEGGEGEWIFCSRSRSFLLGFKVLRCAFDVLSIGNFILLAYSCEVTTKL